MNTFNKNTGGRSLIGVEQLKLLCLLLLFLTGGSVTTLAQSFSITGDSSVCANQIHEYIALPSGNYNYSWGAVGGSIVNTNEDTLSVQWSNPGQGTVTLLVYDSVYNLIDTVSLSTHINYIPEPTILPEKDQECIRYQPHEAEQPPSYALDSNECNVVCADSKVKYEPASVNPGSTYNWQVTGDYINVQNNGNNIVVHWDDSGQGVVHLEETTEEGCTGSTSLCVVIVDRPEAEFDTDLGEGDELIACQYSDIRFFDQSSDDVISWEWNFGDGSPGSTEQNPIHAYEETGHYEVELTVTNECGCKDTYIREIEVVEGPNLDLYCISPVCPETEATYDIIHLDGEPCEDGYEIEVFNGELIEYNNDDPDNQFIDVVWHGDEEGGEGIITISSPCHECDVKFYIPIFDPFAEIAGKDTVCVNDQEEYSIPLWPGTNYNWNIQPQGAGTIIGVSGNNEVIVEWNSSAANGALLSVEYEHPVLECESGYDEFEVIALPEYELDGPDELCGDTAVAEYDIVTSQITGSETFDYIVTDQQSGNPVSSGSFTGTNFGVQFTSPGNYLVKTTNTSGHYCEAEAYYSTTILEAPDPPDALFINGDRTVCPGRPYNYDYTEELPQEFYLQWGAEGGTPDSSTSNPTSVQWQAGVTKNLSAQFVMKDEPGCSSEPVTVNISEVDLSTAPINGPSNTCNNSVRTYTNTGDGDDYSWSVSPNNAGAVTSGDGSDQVSIQWHNYTGTALISVDRKICDSTITDTLTVTLVTTPSVSIISDDTVCQDEPVTFNTSPGGGQSFDWDFGPLGSSQASTPVITYEDSGSFSVGVEVIFPGCQVPSTDQKLIYVRPAPVVFISTNDPLGLCFNPQLSATLQGSGGGVTSYEWYGQSQGFLGTGSTFSPTAPDIYYAIGSISTMQCSAQSNSLWVPECDTGTSPSCNPADSIVPGYSYLGCGEVEINPSINNGRILEVTVMDDVPDTYTQLPAVHQFDKAAFYNTAIKARVISTNGVDSCDIEININYEVPLIPDFTHSFACAPGSNEYEVNFLNTSTFTPGNNLTSAVWQTSSGTFSTNIPDASINLPAGTSETITLIVTNPAESCTLQHVVDVPDKPQASFTASQPACVDQAVSFTDNSTGDIKSWFWDYDGSEAYIEGNSHSSYDQASTFPHYQPSLTVTDQYGCTSVHSETVMVSATSFNPSNGITPSGPFMNCNNDCVELNFDASGLNTPTYIWSNLETSQSIDACQGGSYTLTVTDAFNGCVDRFGPVHIGFHPLPEPTVLGDSVMCLNDFYRLRGNAGEDYDYKWLNQSGNVIGSQPNLSLWSGTTPGPGYVDLVIEDPVHGCADTGRFHYHVQPDLGVQITSPDPAPYCENNNVEFNHQLNNPPAAGINWSTGHSSSPVTANTPGAYSITAYDAFGCKSTDQEVVGANPNVSNFLCGCYEFCYEDEFELYGIPGSYPSWTWLLNGSVYQTGSGQVTPITALLGTNEYQLITTGPNGCHDTTCVSEITVNTCRFEDPCEVKPCDEECDIVLEGYEYIECLGYGPGGQPIYETKIHLYNWMNITGNVFYVEDMSGNPIPISGSSVMPPNSVMNFTALISAWPDEFPFCMKVFVEFEDFICIVEICLEDPPQRLECPDDKFGKQAVTVEENEDEARFDLYPNPAKNRLNLEFTQSENADVMIYSGSGQTVFTQHGLADEGRIEINTSKWPAGMYLIHFKTSEGVTKVRKVAVTR